MSRRPYFGVTGIATPDEAGDVITLYRDAWNGAEPTHDLMLGVLASAKTIRGETNSKPRRYPTRDALAYVFLPHEEGVVQLLHCAENLPPRWLLGERPDLSLDAEGRLRDEADGGGRLVMDKVGAYLRACVALAEGWEPGEERDAVGRTLWKKAPSRGMWIGVSVDKIADVVSSLAYLAGVAPGVMLTRIAAGDGPAPDEVALLSERARKILAAAGAYQAVRAAEARAETSGVRLLAYSRGGIDMMPPAPRWADNAAIRLQFGPAADAVGALLDACEAPEVEALAERRAEARREHVEADARALTRIPAPPAGQERAVEEALGAAGFWVERSGAEWILTPKGGVS